MVRCHWTNTFLARTLPCYWLGHCGFWFIPLVEQPHSWRLSGIQSTRDTAHPQLTGLLLVIIVIECQQKVLRILVYLMQKKMDDNNTYVAVKHHIGLFLVHSWQRKKTR